VVKPDVVAPGNLMRSTTDKYSTLYNLYPGNRLRGSRSSYDYFVLSGTSMATPVVSGAAAMLLQQDPTLTPDQVKARLMKTAYKAFPAFSISTDPVTLQTYTSYYDLFTVVRATWISLAAFRTVIKLRRTLAARSRRPPPTKLRLILCLWFYGNASVPANSVVWGTSVVWARPWFGEQRRLLQFGCLGHLVVWGTNTLSGFSVVWGTSTSSATSVVWGTAST